MKMTEKKIIFRVTGMHCVTCVSSIEQQLARLPGIIEIRVNFAHEQVITRYNPDAVSSEKIVNAISKLGYNAQIWREQKEELEKLEARKEVMMLIIKLVISVILSGLLLTGSFLPQVFIFLTNPWVMLILATPVQFWIGAHFYRNAWKGLRQGIVTMDTLVALGTSVAYFFSVFVVIGKEMLKQAGLPIHIYFDASATIITFILLGNVLETWARRRTSIAIRKLMGLQPKTVLVFQPSENIWQEVPIEQVDIDDLVRVKPGAQIPVDGIIMHGSSSINESMITGESMPVFKKEKAEVIGGTVNMTGSFDMKATKVGHETMLARIIELVRSAQASKATVQKLVDKVSQIFVPSVIVLSILSFIVWMVFGPEPQLLYAVISMVSVLIIACPCALGLATPISIIVGIGRGAQEGILIKEAQTLEIAGNIDVVVFDKTGTLTQGKQEVKEFDLVDNLDSVFQKLSWQAPEGFDSQTFALMLIYKLEELSDHPISQAVIRYLHHEQSVDQALKDKLILEDFANIEGLGLRGRFDNHTIILGSRQLMKQEHIPVSTETDTCAIAWSKEAKTVSLVAIDNQIIGLFCVADTIRTGAQKVVAKLKALGIRLIMITGDNEFTARAVAKQIGIDEVLAKVLPADKAKEIEKLCKEGSVVAMVGDGVNDAPALAVADVGIAMGSGTDIALETAGVALLRNDITLVPKVITLSLATIRNIRQNLVWAFGYNILLIPVAMGALYPFFGIMLNPILAGAAMAFSSLSVVLNALRLRWVKL